MKIAKIQIQSSEFGIEEFQIDSEKNSEINMIVHMRLPLASSAIEAIKAKKSEFECNGYRYQIIEYTIYDHKFFGSKKRKVVDLFKDQKPCTIYIYKTKCHCISCERKYGFNSIENRTAVISTLSGSLVTVDVQFCKHCGSYYIDAESLEMYENKFGPLRFKREFVNEIDSSIGNRHIEYSFDSVLTEYGYNARQDGPSSAERRAILSEIIGNGIASKYEIKEHLSSLIHFRKNRYPDAAMKWQEDLEYVNGYDFERQLRVKGGKIIRK